MPLLQDPCTNKKVFFAHPPRTGGRTVEAMFVNTNKWKSTLTSMYLPPWWTEELSLNLRQMKPECAFYKGIELSHLCYVNYRDFIDPSTIPSFMVCRNPLSRFQSYVSYGGSSIPLVRESSMSTAERRNYLANNWDDRNIFLKPQYKYCNQHMKIWRFEDGFGPDFISWLNKEFNLNLNAAYVFGLDADNKDSHVLRTANDDLGPAPNIKNVGDGGYGYMIDILGQYNYSTQLKFDFGYRWWLFDTDSGNTKFGPNFTTAFPNRSLKSERSGLLIGANYSF